MERWSGLLLALSSRESPAMASRLMACLHPVAGRPLVWHTAASLATAEPAPTRLVVATDVDIPPDLFHDLPIDVELLRTTPQELGHTDSGLAIAEPVLVVDAAAPLDAAQISALLDAESGGWLPAEGGDAAAAMVNESHFPQLFRLQAPLSPPNGVLGMQHRLRGSGPVLVVRDREQLARIGRTIHDRVVRNLMGSGVTFLLPESVLVDVDVRIGRDSVVYPGVVLEGQTTIGEETVIGPGCRVIESWVGSGVELKGWNYVSHASIRNRAILEPYVRRGFD